MRIPISTLRLYIPVILFCLFSGSCKKSNTANPVNTTNDSTTSYDFSWHAASPDPNNYSFAFTCNAPGALYNKWDFGDGTTIQFPANPTHTYKSLGTYTVTLTVFNSKPVQKVLNVSLYLPHTFYYTGAEVTDSTLSFYTNVLPDSTFLWSFGDGTQSRAPEPKHAWHAPGQYAVTLSINGRVSNQSTITISNNPLYTHLLTGTRNWTHSYYTVIDGNASTPTITDESFAITYLNPVKIGFGDTVLYYDPVKSTDSVLMYGYDYWNRDTYNHYVQYVSYYRLKDSIHIYAYHYIAYHWTGINEWDTK